MPELSVHVLPPGQRALWDRLQAHAAFLKDQGYYLAGGSALALQIGHRQSLDFDFFSNRPALGEPTQHWLEQLGDVVVREFDRDTLHAQVGGVKVSFISAYRYPTVQPLVETGGIRLAGLLDIALMKLLALTHRATVRDYLDLAAILRAHMDLPTILEASRTKYGARFDVMLFLRALVTFSDVEPEFPVLLDRSLQDSWQTILREAVKRVAGSP